MNNAAFGLLGVLIGMAGVTVGLLMRLSQRLERIEHLLEKEKRSAD